MKVLAPNLSVMVGPVIGARLMAHSGSLINLAKNPASTIQLIGAEKSLFRALKTKKNTPKYGIIYHAELVNQVSSKDKASLVCRYVWVCYNGHYCIYYLSILN